MIGSIPRKIRRYIKICLYMMLAFCLMIFIYKKINGSKETFSYATKMHNKKYQNFEDLQYTQDKVSNNHPNAIELNDYSKKDSPNYQNNELLAQKLRPKLKKPIIPISNAQKPHDELWAGELGVANNEEELRFRESGYEKYAFNTLVSSRLGLSRTLPDTRHKECKKLTYSVQLPSASIIICYYHEDLGVLLRTIHSVLERTPSNILKEILVINDQSDIDISHNITQHLGIQTDLKAI